MILTFISIKINSFALRSASLRSTGTFSKRLRLSSPGLAEEAVPVIINDRYSSKGLTLDTVLIGENPEIVVSHLKARKANANIFSSVQRIGELRLLRNKVIVDGDAGRNSRKSLSQQIGQLMKEKKMDEVEELKKQVDLASEISAKADAKLAEIDNEINSLFSYLPNLIDDR